MSNESLRTQMYAFAALAFGPPVSAPGGGPLLPKEHTLRLVRDQLTRMGPERVRRSMAAFEHRPPSPDTWGHPRRPCPETRGSCCFLSHAYERDAGQPLSLSYGRAHLAGVDVQLSTFALIRAGQLVPVVEAAFEEWASRFIMVGLTFVNREELRAECVRFLAEHGVAVEPALTPAVSTSPII